ncbi:MAG: CDP-glycerol glycerophosphotransferase family protein [Coriobacteriia bacterium]|nr:CDP-glycerol glycerophosphotransferase family protein [Coriobacteriia bacterium]
MNKPVFIEKLKRLCPPAIFRQLQRFENRRNIACYRKFSKDGIRENKVVFLSQTRDELDGNFRFINKALKSTSLKATVLLKSDHRDMENVMRQVAHAHYVIVDDFVRYMYTLPLNPQSKFIQVWHSAGAFKRMGFARMEHEGSTIRGSLTHRNYTDVIVSSEGVVDNFAEAFGIDRQRIHPIGVPRTDIFFDEKYKQRKRDELRQKCGIKDGRKTVLFAPTYRGNDVNSAYYPNGFIDFNALAQALGSDYVIVIKFHPFIKQDVHIQQENEHRIIDMSEIREINDLLFMADVLITDYSSVIFEYALLNKPVIFYTPDREEYTRKRDFFYNFSTYCYGPVVTSQEGLAEAILNPSFDFALNMGGFIQKFLSACDGHSTTRFVDEILER